MTDAPAVRRRRAIIVTAWVIAVGGWALVAMTIAYATRLRPLADDYCHGRAAAQGPWEAMVFWFQTWIGDLVQVAITSTLVGQPLAHAPFTVASLIPFLITALGVLAVNGLILTQSASGTRRAAVVAWVTLSPVLLLVWWAFWWAPVVFQPDPAQAPWMLASAITSWQTVNVQYVLVPVLATIAWLWWDARAGGRRWVRLVGFGVLGLLVGLSGLVFGAAALVFVALVWLVRGFVERRLDARRGIEAAVFAAVCTIGLLIAYLAPGTRARAEVLAPGRPLQSFSPRALLDWTFPAGIANWVGDVINAGTVVIAVVAFGAAVLLRLFEIRLEVHRLAITGLALLAFSLLVAVVSRAADGFAYPAYWHDVIPRTFVFLAVIALAAAAGAALDRPGQRLRLVVVGVAAATALAFATGAVFVMQDQISARAAQWAVGPAPAGTADIEAEWVEQCWLDLGETRVVPLRG